MTRSTKRREPRPFGTNWRLETEGTGAKAPEATTTRGSGAKVPRVASGRRGGRGGYSDAQCLADWENVVTLIIRRYKRAS
jgi:hypothetical protein